MPLFRRLAPAVVFLLLALVAVQVVDLVVSTDETRAAEQAGTAHVPGSGWGSGQSEPRSVLGLTDSLFQVFWTRTDHVPEVASAPAAPPPAYAPYAERPTTADGPPVDHVPLA